MNEDTVETAKFTTPKGDRKLAGTAEVAWQHGFDDATLPLEHGRLLLGNEPETEAAPESGENIRLRQGKRSASLLLLLFLADYQGIVIFGVAICTLPFDFGSCF